MQNADAMVSAGRLAALLDCDIKTIHNWEASGRLPPSEKTLGGHRRYRAGDVARAYTDRNLPMPSRLASFLDGALPSLAPHWIRKATTAQLRAELARRGES